jgi:hypothetical protein
MDLLDTCFRKSKLYQVLFNEMGLLVVSNWNPFKFMAVYFTLTVIY